MKDSTGFAAPRYDGLSPYITAKEAAQMLGLSGSGIRKWIATGQLRGVKFGAKLWRIERASVEARLPKPAKPAPEPTPLELVLAQLPALSEDERKRVAVAALTGG